MAASQEWEISSTWEVDEEEGAGASSSLANHVTVRDVRMGDGGVGALEENVCVRLVPGPEKPSCEVTVRFKQQQHAVHCVDVLSTARTCEVYRQNEGDTDVEYVCTTRGQLETTSSLYRAEMELEDPEFCTSVTIRLLSLKEKSHVIIGRILILVSPGAYLSAPVQSAAVGGGASAASLGAMMPLMMQMAQSGFSMPDLKNKMSFISSAESERVKPGPPSQTPPAAPSPALKSEPALLEDVCERLERLESVCARIESSLSKTLESFDKRLRILESGATR